MRLCSNIVSLTGAFSIADGPPRTYGRMNPNFRFSLAGSRKIPQPQSSPVVKRTRLCVVPDVTILMFVGSPFTRVGVRSSAVPFLVGLPSSPISFTPWVHMYPFTSKTRVCCGPHAIFAIGVVMELITAGRFLSLTLSGRPRTPYSLSPTVSSLPPL